MDSTTTRLCNGPSVNRLLGSFPEDIQRFLTPYLEPIDLAAGQDLTDHFTRSKRVVFPLNCIISVATCCLTTGATIEVAAVGSEGMIGFSTLWDEALRTNRAIVTRTGAALQMDSSLMTQAIELEPFVMKLWLLFLQRVLTQTGQTAVCNRHHSVDQQLSRWLLSRVDRLPHTELVITHEEIAQLLGVRRESVSAAAHKLQDAGVISYCRGHITVIDNLELEKRSCECYEIVRKENARLLSSLALPESKIASNVAVAN